MKKDKSNVGPTCVNNYPPPNFLRWADIKSLMGHKKTFILESAQSQRTMQFHFSDPEVVKYVRKICLLQNTFQKDSVKGEQQNGDISQRNSAVNYVSHSSNPADSFVSLLCFSKGSGYY